jgi:hypothetical protein
MKYVKALGLAAAAAMALMAFLGAGSAFAGILCKTNTSTAACSGPYSAGQAFEASASGTGITETLGGTVLDTCTISTLKGKVTNPGNSSEAAKASIEELAWGAVGSGCTKTTDTVATGSLEFSWIKGTDNGTLTLHNSEWTINTIFGTCTYGSGASLDLGTVTGGSPATISINTIVPKITGNIACPSEVRWTAGYTFTEPTPLYFTEG